MASINDLKTTTGYTGTGSANAEELLQLNNPNVKNAPTASVDDSGILKINNPNISLSKNTKSQTDSTSSKRKIADLSTLPKAEPKGVDIKESIEDDILGPGGPFEAVLQQKTQEMLEINELIDQHNAMVAAERGEEVPTDEELDRIGTEDMTAVLRGTKYYDQADAYGRAQGAIQKSPIEDKAAAEGRNPFKEKEIEENNTDSDQNIINFDADDIEEDEDEMEKEINAELEREFNDSAAVSAAKQQQQLKVKVTNQEPKKEEPSQKQEEVKEKSPVVKEVEESKPEQDVQEKEEEVVITEDASDEPSDVEVVENKPEKKEEAQNTISVNVPKEEDVQATTSSNPVSDAVKDPNIGVSTDFNVDDDDFDDIDLEDDSSMSDSNVVEEVNPEENMKKFQASVTEKIRPVTKKLDLSSFTLIKQPISISATSLGATDSAASMSWALPNSDQFIAMREFSGKEIEQLGDNSGTNRYQRMKNRYKLIYDHVVSSKPDTLEAWLKTISYSDNDHLYFAVYGANFAGSNFIPFDCPKCKNTFLSDNIELKDMYKFKNDEAKERFNKLLASQDSPIKPGLYVSDIVQISDKIAIGYRDPSIWNIIFETALLDDKFQQKYRDIIAIISYIDKIYYIDSERATIQEINYKIDVNSSVKTIKAKIITYAKILSRLSPDQYYIILSYINSINDRRDDITYIRPEATCTNCGEVIQERNTTAEELVFTRSQLSTLAITSIS